MVHAGWGAISWVDCFDRGGAEQDETVGTGADAFGEGGGRTQRGIGGSESRAGGNDAYRSADEREEPAVFSGNDTGGCGAGGAQLCSERGYAGAAESRFNFLFN